MSSDSGQRSGSASAMDGGGPLEPERLEDVLLDLAEQPDESGLWKLRTKIVCVDRYGDEIKEDNAFFMKFEGEDGIQFRHEGGSELSPSVVFVSAKKRYELLYESAPLIDGKVAVYCTASGSGKTVELAVSNVTRRAHLSLLVTFREESDPTDEEIEKEMREFDDQLKDETAKERARNKLAFIRLRKAVIGLVKEHRKSFLRILGAKREGALRLVVGIDEASTCPTIVRSIISNQWRAVSALRQGLFEMIASEKCLGQDKAREFVGNDRVSFLFSVAGAGAASPTATIGSLDSSYLRMKPSAVVCPYLYPRHALKEQEMELCLPGATEGSVVTMHEIKKQLPILHCMMENARMASIALMALRMCKEKGATVVEKYIVDKVCRLYIDSNGLRAIRQDQDVKNAVGACAFAMLLFQCDIPEFGRRQKDEEQRYHLDFNCGFDFDEDVVKSFSARTTGDRDIQKDARRKLVAKYGLLEPTECGMSKKPFAMRPSQQLIALSLLGVHLSQLVPADFFGFEVLSTQTMKAGLAASSVVRWKQRMSVKETLEKVGCKVDGRSTDQSTTDEWNGLKDFYVVRHQIKSNTNGTPTRLLRAELEVSTVPIDVSSEDENSIQKTRTASPSSSSSSPTKDGGSKKGNDTTNDFRIEEGSSSPPFAVSGVAATSAAAAGKKGKHGSGTAASKNKRERKVLFIDKEYRKDLSGAFVPAARAPPAPAPAQRRTREGSYFHPPIAAVNNGNSALADGFITCFVAKKEHFNGSPGNDPIKFTAMNQAKCKLGFSGEPMGQLPVTKLKSHAKQCRNPVLNKLFGNMRLLFVSTPKDSTAQGAVHSRRPWLPRALEECEILKELMGTLSFQRTKGHHFDTYTDCVTENGCLVDEEGDLRDDEDYLVDDQGNRELDDAGRPLKKRRKCVDGDFKQQSDESMESDGSWE